jgi:hypothetical protein
MAAPAIFVCALLSLASGIYARDLQAATGVQSQGKSCAAACATPVYFRSIRPDKPSSYACSVATEGGDVIGYQLSTAPSTCIITDADKTVSSQDYSCLCKATAENQGLDLPGASGTCADSCAVSIDGQAGNPVSQEGNYACLASSEVGTSNRFGHNIGSTCSYAAGDSVATSDTFSCMCLFSAAIPTAGPASIQKVQQAALPTAG